MSIPDHRGIVQGYMRRWPRALNRWLLSLLIIFGVPLYFAAELEAIKPYRTALQLDVKGE
jgi:hypothetical protein